MRSKPCTAVRNHALSCICVLLFAFSAIGCASLKPKPTLWQQFSYPEYEGYLYIARTADNTLHLAICGNFMGIEASIRTTHACTEEQFSALKGILESQGCSYKGEVFEPDTSNYPDLSAYLTFIFSSDELHELWKGYGLE